MAQVAGFAELEALLNEFVVTTDNQRKKQIESVLEGLKNSPEAWKQALMMLNQSNNPYILFFACSVLEETLRSKWSSLVGSNDHLTVRKFIVDYLSTIAAKNAQPFVVTKICAVLVHIAKNDFPAQYSNYFNDISQFLSNPATVQLGVLLIKLTSEEFTVARDIPSQRKNEIKAALSQQVPYLLSRIVEILDALYNQNVAVSGSDVRSNFDKNQPALYLVRDCFETILHLFSWIPLNEILQPAQLDTIFKYIQLNDATSLLAFECVNEVMSKNYVPKQFEQFLLQIFTQVFILLQKVTAVDLSKLNSDFVQKFTLFTSLFVSNHLKRVENNPNFAVQDFLALLFKYTLMQPSLEGFLDCLDIWSVFIDYLKAQDESNTSTKSKYTGGFIMICLELLRKSTFRYNATQLNMLAEEESDSFESEVDEQIGNCVKLIGQIADLYADEVLAQLVPMIVEFISKIKTVHQANETDAKSILKDGATALRTLSVIGNHFADTIRTKYQAGESIMKLLMETLAFTQQQQIFRFGMNGIRLIAEMLGTFRAFTPWLAALSALLRESNFPGGVSTMNGIVSGLLDFIIAVQDPAVPSDISQAAAILFKSIASTVRPGNIASFPKIEQLLQNAYQLTGALSIEVQEQLYVALSLVILLPFPNVAKEAQNWPLRAQQFKSLLDPVLLPFGQLCKSPGFSEQGFNHPNSIALVTRTLRIVTAIFSEFKGESSNIGTESKSILQSATVEFLQLTASLFSIYLSNYLVLEQILNLFVNVFDSMGAIIDANFVQQTIMMFSQTIFNQLPAICASKDLNGIIVACKFEQILSLVVQKPSAPINDILTLAIGRIGPIVLAPTCIAVEIRSNYFQLLHDIVLHQWNKIDAALPAIMQAFATSFTLQDIEEVRRVIKMLDELNQKRKLFGSPKFRETMTMPIAAQILTILVSKSHDLLREHLATLLYNLVEPNPAAFFNQVLPHVLQNDTALAPEQKQRLLGGFSRETDAPTFAQNVNNFISDYYYFGKGGK
jgi:hypothetical protein